MPHQPNFRAPGTDSPSGVLWNCEGNDPTRFPLDSPTLAWLAGHPGTPVKEPFASATPESDAAILNAWVARGHRDDDEIVETYFAACTFGYQSVHPAPYVRVDPFDVRGVTVYDGGVLVFDWRGWMIAEIEGHETTIQALTAELGTASNLYALPDLDGTVIAPGTLLVACAPQFGPLTNLEAWLDTSTTLSVNTPAGIEPVEYLVQDGTKPRVFAVDSDGPARALRALLTCESTDDATQVAHALNMALSDGDIRREDIEAIIDPLLSDGARSAARTELDRLGVT